MTYTIYNVRDSERNIVGLVYRVFAEDREITPRSLSRNPNDRQRILECVETILDDAKAQGLNLDGVKIKFIMSIGRRLTGFE